MGMETEEKVLERALLVGVDTGEDTDFERSMQELKSLAEACGMEPAGIVTQKLPSIHKALYIGTGKVDEVREYIQTLEAQVVVFDNALSPSQLRNLQKELKAPVMDRTTLILDIFSRRARTREAKLQVETARLQYLLPRLVGMHEALTRQGGTSGSLSSKGAGEKQLELDRRKIERRIIALKKELEEVAAERRTQSKRRQSASIPRVSLVGYTNAGKSTLMNRMLDTYGNDESKKVLEKDMLFATLETTVRKIETGDNRDFLLSDTVGFIHKLPHGLIKAFRSTLEEVKDADLLLHVIDYSDEHFRQQAQVTEDTLRELEASEIPVIFVFNKADKREDGMELPRIQEDNKIYMSAKSGQGLQELVELILKKLYADRVEVRLLIPFAQGAAVSYFMENALIKEQQFREDGTYLKVVCSLADRDRYAQFMLPNK